MTMESLRIVITADPELPVPPRFYGGIERVIALLVDGLTARGHAVTLVAHRDSRIRARLVPYRTTGNRGWSVVSHAATVGAAVARSRPHVLHSFGRLASLGPLLPLRLPKVMSYQRLVTPATVSWANRLGNQLTFVGCSRRQIAGLPGNWRVVHNGVDVESYTFASHVASDAPLVFLGRIEAIKGAHIAIAMARAAGRKLIIAGNVPAGHQAYFEESIRAHLADGVVSYVGPVDDRAKSELLSRAAALLMPVLWEEPFGIVMAEALACGTPVIGFDRGAVPEVVRDGLTGFVCASEAGIAGAVRRIGQLSREACRRDAERRFSGTALVDGYEQVYRELVGRRVSRPVVNEEPVLAPRRD